MPEVAAVGLVDARGWLLLQERDERAPTDPDRWSLVAGRVEPGETPRAAAHRELAEETALPAHPLETLGRHELACPTHGIDVVHLFWAPTVARDADVVCGEGRRIVFVDPAVIPTLDLATLTPSLYPLVLTAAAARSSRGSGTMGV